jgi:hypothetical protein
MDWNPYSDLSWAAQACYHWDYFSPYDRYVWILDCLVYGDRINSMNALTLKERKSDNTFWVTMLADSHCW